VTDDPDPPRPADLPPGYDEDDPYGDADLGDYPEWWRRNAEEFRRHGMRPYRPPRFADGEVTTGVVAALEADLGVTVRFRSVNPHEDGEWAVWVEGDRVATVERTRTQGGYSRYGITADEFRELVRRSVESG